MLLPGFERFLVYFDHLRKLCISANPSLRAQQSNPFWLANQAFMDRRVAALLAMADLCRTSLACLPQALA
jgi:hypothetical protein